MAELVYECNTKSAGAGRAVCNMHVKKCNSTYIHTCAGNAF